jgi:hypothetical protein
VTGDPVATASTASGLTQTTGTVDTTLTLPAYSVTSIG